MAGYSDRPWLAAYPPDVPTECDFPKVPLTRLLDDAARSYPGNIAISSLGNKLTYRALQESVDRFAAGLAELGVAQLSRVAIVLPNCPQHVVAFFAVLRLGAIVVHCNPLSPPEELCGQLIDSGASVVVCLDRMAAEILEVRGQTRVKAIVVTSLADARTRAARGRLELPLLRNRKAELVAAVPENPLVHRFRVLARTATPARQAPLNPTDDVAVLQYTSGTTGEPRAAMLSHANLVANCHQIRMWFPDAVPGQEVTLATVPLFHAYGLTLCMLTTVLLGGRLVLLPRFDVDAVLDAIDEERPTLFPAVPPIFRALVDHPKLRKHDLSKIRACVSGAMKLPPDLVERFEKATEAPLIEGYGMTETSPVTHCVPLTGDRKPGSVGLPLPGTRARIVDPDQPNVERPVGEPGELAIQGPQVFLGYWSRVADVVPPTIDGWWLTGDIATMDHEGWFTIVDRKKDLIIAGGFNISPTEVEQAILGVAGVTDCCVVGLPDRYRGETVKAYVVAPGGKVTEDEVKAACAAALSAYKVPKLVEFRDELPRTAVGKALRRLLVDEELAESSGTTSGEGGRR
ncbi:MAG TPA: long-chain fatty acid--CoA ligase [Mycobacteriales bacterium]|nr:long-chain fatty acid--CoA ligase [Mycobacteriales bacterium]